MEDKELMDSWNDEFKKLLLATGEWKISDFKNVRNGKYFDWKLDAMWEMFLIAKRSQPSVVLPEKYDKMDCDIYYCDEVHAAITAAGIKYATS